MASIYDLIAVGFYLLFILWIGYLFRAFNRDSSDYFRGGGSMLWWMCGGSAFMVTISAWSFTGGAGRVYQDGPSAALLYVGNFMGALFCAYFTAWRFRRMRVTTYVQGIRRRYGAANEQFYTWIQMPVYILYGGIALNAIGVFFSAIFGWPMLPTMVVIGSVCVVMAVMGGAWSVVASDFVQMLLVLIIVVLVFVFTVQLPELGGIAGLYHGVFDRFGMPWDSVRMPVFIGWMLALFINQFLALNNMAEGAARYLMVRDDREARRAASLLTGLIILAPALLMIPPLSVAVLDFDLALDFPQLTRANEAAFVAISLKVLPDGMIGFLVCAIFAATMSSMDSALNRNSGIFCLNVYKVWIRPAANEAELVKVGRIFTVFFGSLVLLMAVLIHQFRSLGLFDLMILLVASFSLPLIIPLFYGLFIRHAPSWAGWSTALCGFAAAQLVYWAIDLHLLFARFWSEPLSVQEFIDARYAVTVFAVLIASSSWYLMATFLHRRKHRPAPQVESFFSDLNTPVDPLKEGIADNSAAQCRILAQLCATYGAFLLLGILIPNAASGRLCFLFAGLVLLAVALLLRRGSRHPSDPIAAPLVPPMLK